MAVIGEEDLLFIPFRIFVYVVAGLPLCSLILCISLALMLHFDEANRTHCNVPNWLPSVSAIVASFSPEKYIWRIFIGLHSAPRFLVAFAFRYIYYNYFFNLNLGILIFDNSGNFINLDFVYIKYGSLKQNGSIDCCSVQSVDAEVLFSAEVNLSKNPTNVGDSSVLLPRDSLAYLSNATSQRSDFNQ